MDKHIREFTKMLGCEGLKLSALTRTGKGHYKAVVESPDKRKMTYILASTTSDARAGRNIKTDIKRFFNN
jgi:hypothetical protein